MNVVRDLRCPEHTKKLFARLDRSEALIEVSCADCRRRVRSDYPDIAHVIHRFAVMTGELVDTVWEWPSGQISPDGQAPLRIFRGGAR